MRRIIVLRAGAPPAAVHAAASLTVGDFSKRLGTLLWSAAVRRVRDAGMHVDGAVISQKGHVARGRCDSALLLGQLASIISITSRRGGLRAPRVVEQSSPRATGRGFAGLSLAAAK